MFLWVFLINRLFFFFSFFKKNNIYFFNQAFCHFAADSVEHLVFSLYKFKSNINHAIEFSRFLENDWKQTLICFYSVKHFISNSVLISFVSTCPTKSWRREQCLLILQRPQYVNVWDFDSRKPLIKVFDIWNENV